MSVDKYQMRHVNGTSHENLDISVVGAGLVSIITKFTGNVCSERIPT